MWEAWVTVPGELHVSDDVSAGAWIAARLEGRFGVVTRTVPSGFAAYARVCHPATDRSGREATWPEVARQTGRQAHPLMQWHALVGSADSHNMTGSLWPGDDPRRGTLAGEALARLCDVLADHTATADRCVFCLWEGWGWIDSSAAGDADAAPRAARASSVDVSPIGADDPIAPAFSPEELRRPRLQLPDRAYLLLTGPLAAALQIGWQHGPHSFAPQSPNLFWPADHAWCVASEIDFDSTLVGGTTELVDAVLRAPELDSWPVGPRDSLAHDADAINPVP